MKDSWRGEVYPTKRDHCNESQFEEPDPVSQQIRLFIDTARFLVFLTRFSAQKQGKREGTKSAKEAAKKNLLFAAFFAIFVPSRLPWFWLRRELRWVDT